MAALLVALVASFVGCSLWLSLRNIAHPNPTGNTHRITREYFPILPPILAAILDKAENTNTLKAGLSMAERFGAQAHPNGGVRFGSQTYAAVDSVAGDMAAIESGPDIFEGVAQPNVDGNMSAAESAADVFAGAGASSLSQTMQAHESPAPDTLIITGYVIEASSVRFGASEHPLGGLRFGTQAWAALGPGGPMAATESGADTAAAVGWMAGLDYSFAAFDILASFVDYTGESLGAAITGTLDDGDKVMLPVSGAGITFTWETNAFGNPSLRLASLTGATILADVPWYVWGGTIWTPATFDVSDAMQGAAFMVESGADIFFGNGSGTHYGAMAATEAESDFVQISGSVAVSGLLSAIETGADSLAATGAPSYVGSMDAFEGEDGDTAEITGAVEVLGNAAAIESGEDVFAADGAHIVTGALDAAESGPDSFAAAGSLTSTGDMVAAESAIADTAAMSGGVVVTVALAADESGDDVFAATGESERTGAAALVESGADTLTADGTVAIAGDLAATEETDRFYSIGQREFIGDLIAAELSALEGGADRFVARGINGDLVPLQTFDGPVETLSTTRVIGITSRRTAEAA